MKNINLKPDIIKHVLPDTGEFPNSSLPVKIYREAFLLPEKKRSKIIINIFSGNNWKNSWKNGIYNYHHYHSTTHEVLGVYRGRAEVQFGGPAGVIDTISRGDAVIIPAGVAHKLISSSKNFKIVGAYPFGVEFNSLKGEEWDRPAADLDIRNARIPDKDPIYGNTFTW